MSPWATVVSSITFSSSSRRRRAPSKLRERVTALVGLVFIDRPMSWAGPGWAFGRATAAWKARPALMWTVSITWPSMATTVSASCGETPVRCTAAVSVSPGSTLTGAETAAPMPGRVSDWVKA